MFSIKSAVSKVREEAGTQAFVFSQCVHTVEKEKSKNLAHKLKSICLAWKTAKAEKV